jgi:polyhydroxybutyrate depolymerase
VRAVASVAGVLDLRRHPPKGPVPVLHIHGTADDHVPFQGGTGTGAVVKVAYPPVPRLILAWVAAQRRALTRQQSVIDPAREGMRVQVTRWSDSAGRDRVVLMAVEGGGHAWHGDRRAARHGGTRDIDATTEVLRFFSAWR